MTMSSVPSAPSAGCSVLFCLAVLWVVWRSALSGMQKYGPDGGHMAAQKVSRLLRLFFLSVFRPALQSHGSGIGIWTWFGLVISEAIWLLLSKAQIPKPGVSE